MNAAVANIGLESGYNSCQMDIWKIYMNLTETLQILTEGFSFLWLEKLQVAGPTRLLVATGEGTDELVAQV